MIFQPIISSLNLKFKLSLKNPLKVYHYKNGNFDGLGNYLSRFPINIATTIDIDDCWQQWKNAFLTAVQMYVPMKTIKNTNTPPWIDKEVRNLISRKYKALKKTV